jgi:Lon-like ATP-dependent protease
MQVHDSPLKVAVKHLRDEPYDPSDDTLKATTLEIVSTLKELLHLHPLYNEQLRR